MDIERLSSAVDRVRSDHRALTARQTTYLRTYYPLVELATMRADCSHRRFLQLVTAAYGWMPRVVRINPEQLDSAVDAFSEASNPNDAEVQQRIIESISNCLFSVVGASKALHFVNPDVYPIWDSKVQRVWGRAEPSQHYMSQAKNYISYAQEVHALRNEPGFNQFYSKFKTAYEERLQALGIPVYSIGQVRAIEAAAFELSGGEYEDA